MINIIQKELKIDFVLLSSVFFILLLSTLLHYWNLEKTHFPIFDEVYFPRYANEYLKGNPSWEGHPPLSKYLIMLGILLLGDNPMGSRFMSALMGSFLPIISMGFIYQLTQNRKATIFTGVLVSLDGLLLVESRLGLINIFLVTLGFASLIFLFKGVQEVNWKRAVWLSLSGIMLGATGSIKWNGLGFFLTIALAWALLKLLKQFHLSMFKEMQVVNKIETIKWWEFMTYLLVTPILFYCLQWIPHFMLNPGINLLGMNPFEGFYKFIITIHRHIIWWHGNIVTTDLSKPIHPYCSTIYSWPILGRPIGYYFNKVEETIVDIHAIGNPILWWLSTISILVLSFRGIKKVDSIEGFLLIGYAANYLPWIFVHRCLFLYHYMTSSIFSFMTTAYILNLLILNKKKWSDSFVIIIGISIVISFLFFLPIWLGLPISTKDFYARMWFMPNKITSINWI